MIDIKPPVSQQGFRRFPEDIDALLRAFMEAEMPKTWPAMGALPPPLIAPTRARRWLQPGSRFALAASLAAFLVGSFALTSVFPTQPPTSREQGNDEVIADVRGTPFETITDQGHKVKGWEKQEGNTIIIKIELDDMP